MIVFILYFLFNITERDNLIYAYFNIDPFQPIENIDSYRKAMKTRDIFVVINKIIFICIGLISLVLCFTKRDNHIKRYIQVIVVVFMALFLLMSIFSGSWH